MVKMKTLILESLSWSHFLCCQHLNVLFTTILISDVYNYKQFPNNVLQINAIKTYKLRNRFSFPLITLRINFLNHPFIKSFVIKNAFIREIFCLRF